MTLIIHKKAFQTGICLILFVGCNINSTSPIASQSTKTETTNQNELVLKIDHPGLQGEFFHDLAFSVVLRNVGSRPLLIRRPDLGINLRVFCKTKTAMEWNDMIDARNAVTLPEMNGLPSRSSSPIVLLRPNEILEEFVDFDCDQGDYQVKGQYLSEKEPEVNWFGECESNVLSLTVPPEKHIQEVAPRGVFY